jgi:hypothetical protein
MRMRCISTFAILLAGLLAGFASAAPRNRSLHDEATVEHAKRMTEEGRQTFRFDTF